MRADHRPTAHFVAVLTQQLEDRRGITARPERLRRQRSAHDGDRPALFERCLQSLDQCALGVASFEQPEAHPQLGRSTAPQALVLERLSHRRSQAFRNAPDLALEHYGYRLDVVPVDHPRADPRALDRDGRLATATQAADRTRTIGPGRVLRQPVTDRDDRGSGLRVMGTRGKMGEGAGRRGPVGERSEPPIQVMEPALCLPAGVAVQERINQPHQDADPADVPARVGHRVRLSRGGAVERIHGDRQLLVGETRGRCIQRRCPHVSHGRLQNSTMNWSTEHARRPHTFSGAIVMPGAGRW